MRVTVLLLLVTLACTRPAAVGPPVDAGAAHADAGSVDAGLPDAPLVNPSRFNTVLGRPTDTTVAVSILASPGDSARVEWSTAVDAARTTLLDPRTTASVSSADGSPIVVEVEGLQPDARHYYRVLVTPAGGTETADALHAFHTRRVAGRAFHFGVQGDTHPERYNDKMFHPELFTLTLEQVRDRQPDLYFTLGDDFSIEKIIQNFKTANYGASHSFHRSVEGAVSYADYQALPHPFSSSMIVDGNNAPRGYAAYREMRESYLGIMAASTHLFLVNGNHEQAHAANLGGVFSNAATWAAEARLRYYPLPAPGGGYTGDQERVSAGNGYPALDAPDGLLRDYYAFTWGDALFVTLDPYWHSPLQSPDSSLYDGDPEDPWLSTLGDAQYAWLKETLEGSAARWKFVFAHHVNGNNRGAAAVVGREEWGGPSSEFLARRPGWDKPVHQLLVDTGVTIFFQGHDHLFAREVVDGVVYQEVPNPGDNSYFAYNCDAYAPAAVTWQGPAGYGRYDAAASVRLPDTGFLDVSVEPSFVRVRYVRSYRDVDLRTRPNGAVSATAANGEIAFTYSIPPQPGDDDPADFPLDCSGAAPPPGWVYNP